MTAATSQTDRPRLSQLNAPFRELGHFSLVRVIVSIAAQNEGSITSLARFSESATISAGVFRYSANVEF
jgi:hypothetical protein